MQQQPVLDIEHQIGIVIQTNQYSEQLYNNKMPELLFQQWSVSAYRMALFIICLSIPIIFALIVYGLIKMKNNVMKRTRKVYLYSLNICMVITIVNIIYWNWCMFWMI